MSRPPPPGSWHLIPSSGRGCSRGYQTKASYKYMFALSSFPGLSVDHFLGSRSPSPACTTSPSTPEPPPAYNSWNRLWTTGIRLCRPAPVAISHSSYASLDPTDSAERHQPADRPTALRVDGRLSPTCPGFLRTTSVPVCCPSRCRFMLGPILGVYAVSRCSMHIHP